MYWESAIANYFGVMVRYARKHNHTHIQWLYEQEISRNEF